MAFHESAIFPTDISYGSTGGAGYSTVITKLDSGHEIRSERWEQARHQYDASYGIKTLTELKTVLEFFHARKGSAHGFRWLDPMDYSTDSTRRGTASWDDVELGVIDSNNQIQLATKYTNGGNTVTRNLEKPISGTVKVGWDGAEKTENTDWSIDYATGVITASASSGNNVSAGAQFHVPCRFGEEVDEHLPLSFDAFELGSIGSVPVVEIKSALENVHEYDFGGATEYTTGATSITRSHGLADGRLIHCTTTGAGHIYITLPTITGNMATGAPYFIASNNANGGTGDVILIEGSTTLKTLASDKACIIGVSISVAGVRSYFLMGG